jgi:hypothetical protein
VAAVRVDAYIYYGVGLNSERYDGDCRWLVIEISHYTIPTSRVI